MQGRIETRRRGERSAPRRIAAVALAAALVGGEAGAQLSTDFCGCEGSPNSLGDFHSNDPATWPPGSQQVATGCSPILEIPLPEDGVLIFDSFTVGNMATSGCGVRDATVRFAPNPANTPVTLLVRGNVTIESGDLLSVNGFAGSNGTTGSHGTGGRGGPGGFAGGDGAYQLSNLAADGSVVQVQNMLSDEQFRQLATGTWTPDMVRCMFGPPAIIDTVGLPSNTQIVWSYRYKQAGVWNSLMYVYFGTDGKRVTRHHAGPDPLYDRDSNFFSL